MLVSYNISSKEVIDFNSSTPTFFHDKILDFFILLLIFNEHSCMCCVCFVLKFLLLHLISWDKFLVYEIALKTPKKNETLMLLFFNLLQWQFFVFPYDMLKIFLIIFEFRIDSDIHFSICEHKRNFDPNKYEKLLSNYLNF